MSDYVFDRDGKQVIKTQALRQCLDSFVRPLTEGKTPGSWTLPVGFSSRVQDTLGQATQLHNRISVHHDSLEDETGPEQLGAYYTSHVPAVLRMALLTLDYMAKLFTYLIPGVKQVSVNLFRSKLNEQSVRQRFDKNNWCPSAYDLLGSISYSAAEYASLIRRPGSQSLHQNCSTDRCTARNVDDKSAIPTHVEASCNCAFWVPPLSEIFDILQERQIPLLSAKSILGHDESTSEPVVRAYEDGMKFTSFSHLWADGLGSTSEDGLPRCQIERLCKKVTNDYFWVDALCIPKNESLRKNAIRSMAQIYSKADTVLVLDAGLNCESVEELDAEELCVKVLTSDWNQRLWTLQEAMLSRSLEFEFKDTRKPLQAVINYALSQSGMMYTPLLGCVQPLGHLWMAFKHTERFDNIRDRRAVKKDSVPLGLVIELLAKRSSSKLSDEPLAVASLIGVDVAPLLDVSGDERMQKLLLELKYVSAKSVFAQAEKMTKPGFRWAPRSFIECGPWHHYFSRQDKWPGVITEAGLQGRHVVIRFLQAWEPPIEPSDYILLDQPNQKYYSLKTRKVPKKHRVTELIISADTTDSLHSHVWKDALCLEREDETYENMSVYVPHGVCGFMPYDGEPRQSDVAKEVLLVSAPQMEDFIIS